MLKVIITLGYPACGKSTFIRRMNLGATFKIFDSDEYDRSMSYYERNRQMCEEIIDYAETGNDFVIAAASGGSEFEETLKYLRSRRYSISIFYFKCNKALAKRRNECRKRTVPDEVYDQCDTLIPINMKLARKYTCFVYTIEQKE